MQIKLEIMTYNNFEERTFKKYDDLFDFCRSRFCMLVSTDFDGLNKDAESIAKTIWNASTGEYIKTDMGHIICIADKKLLNNSDIAFKKPVTKEMVQYWLGVDYHKWIADVIVDVANKNDSDLSKEINNAWEEHLQ